MRKIVSVEIPNVRDGRSRVLEIALEPDETTLKVSIVLADNECWEIHVRAVDLIEAASIFYVCLKPDGET
jgi:hypothetical protein